MYELAAVFTSGLVLGYVASTWVRDFRHDWPAISKSRQARRRLKKLAQ
jgi:hypothetical protein